MLLFKKWWIIADGIKTPLFKIHSVVLEPVFLPLYATIFTLPTAICSVTSLNSTSLNTEVCMLTQRRQVFREPLTLTGFWTLSPCSITASSNCSTLGGHISGMTGWDCRSSQDRTEYSGTFGKWFFPSSLRSTKELTTEKAEDAATVALRVSICVCDINTEKTQ